MTLACGSGPRQLLLARLRAAGQLDWSRAVVDSSHVRALNRGDKTGARPVRGRAGSKHHLLTDEGGIPLAVRLTGGNRNDVTQAPPLLNAVPPVWGRRGRSRRTPEAVWADRGDARDSYRRRLRQGPMQADTHHRRRYRSPPSAQVAPVGQLSVTGGNIREWMGQVGDHGAGESDDGIKKVTEMRTTPEG